jgi:hypothetical protein
MAPIQPLDIREMGRLFFLRVTLSQQPWGKATCLCGG